MRFPQDEARSDKEGFHNEVGYALRFDEVKLHDEGYTMHDVTR